MKRLLFLTMIMAGALVSCEKPLPPASLELDTTTYDAGFEGASFSLSLLSNRDWTATTDADWISVSPSSGSAGDSRTYITVTVQPNDGGPRSAVITVTNSELTCTINVNQGESSQVIRTADKFIEYLNAAAKQEAANGYCLGADIDLSGKTLPVVDSLVYSLDCAGFKLKNWTSSAPLFKKVTLSGQISNLVIDSSCKLTVPGDQEKFGFVTNWNAGVLDNIVNNADVTVDAICKSWTGAICGESTGALRNCVNNGAISFSGAPQTDGTCYIGGVAGRINGAEAAMQDCENHGPVSITFNGVLSQSIYAAGVTGAVNNGALLINGHNTAAVTVRLPGNTTNGQASGVVCYCGGDITGCTNSGAISLYSESADGKADGPVKGTGVAGIACYAGGNVVMDCENSGDITMRAGYTLAQQTVGSAKKFSSNVAGVIAHAYTCEIRNCTNTGKVRSEFRNIDNEASVYNTTARQSVAGIVASPWGKVSECTNKGKIEVVWTTKAHDAGLNKQFGGQVGGVAGGDYHSEQTNSSIEDCTNEGDMDLVCDATGYNNAFGGIVGWPGKEAAAGVNEVKNCTNMGNLTLDGFSKTRLGGISGGAVKMSGCKNYGTVYFKGGHDGSALGGIMGFNNFFSVDACENYGTVKSDVKMAGAESSAAGGIGGLAGALGNTAQTWSGCKVNCTVSVPEGSAASMLIGVIGQNKAVTTKLELGTQSDPIKVKGTFNGTALTDTNYETYIKRPDFKLENSNILFNVAYGE